MANTMRAPPVLSTPDTHILEDSAPSVNLARRKRTDQEISTIYEIPRTIFELRKGGWQKIALQFPDEMLSDAPRVFELLRDGLKNEVEDTRIKDKSNQSLEKKLIGMTISGQPIPGFRLYILADTSYGACCVDEIAAEHVDAEVVVHYGRACLSPTARLPVVHVFTRQPLNVEAAVNSFERVFPNLEDHVILLADVTYSSHLSSVHKLLEEKGYRNLFLPVIIHNPSSPLPNRSVPATVERDSSSLKDWHLFHISEPPQALLLTLTSRLSSFRIFPTTSSAQSSSEGPEALLANTSLALRHRYALLTALSTVSTFGILINTLSVKNYIHIVEHVKRNILAAGKKSYTFVVGKVNAAKVANFSEVGGWVVIGCWESSLVESKDFWKPVITPFELELALAGDENRVWTGEWRSDFQGLLDEARDEGKKPRDQARRAAELEHTRKNTSDDESGNIYRHGDFDSEEESAPPEFDLRSGRYISHSRPLDEQRRLGTMTDTSGPGGRPAVEGSATLARRAKGDIARIGDGVSPGADFLNTKRTWKGLGSDFEIAYDNSTDESTAVQEGRTGIARGYTNAGAGSDRA